MIETTHNFIASDARRLNEINLGSPTLVVTSPPYPMISMWDTVFAEQSETVATALKVENGQAAFSAMHQILDQVWANCHAALIAGGLICVNIGDAVRTFGGSFQLFANSARVTSGLEAAGFTLLPPIVWRKPANSPTKFMGSGMLPGGAYVTLEHEMIVIGRKGELRRGTTKPERELRRKSAIFWEERNEWYSDLWTLTGVRQRMASSSQRERSAAFPFELAYRLIAMHSWRGDMVVDPFAGTGTTAAAAMGLGRSSVSVDCDEALLDDALNRLARNQTLESLRARARDRLDSHREFIRSRGRETKHTNSTYSTPVVTSQETALEIPLISRIRHDTGAGTIVCDYALEHGSLDGEGDGHGGSFTGSD